MRGTINRKGGEELWFLSSFYGNDVCYDAFTAFLYCFSLLLFGYFSIYVSSIQCVSTKKKFRVFLMHFHLL